MNITSTSQARGFTPFSIAIDVQTPADAARLYALFSDPAVSAVLAGADEDVALDSVAREILRSAVDQKDLVTEPAYVAARVALNSR